MSPQVWRLRSPTSKPVSPFDAGARTTSNSVTASSTLPNRAASGTRKPQVPATLARHDGDALARTADPTMKKLYLWIPYGEVDTRRIRLRG